MFFFNDTATTEIYTLSLHDALPIYKDHNFRNVVVPLPQRRGYMQKDRKSTRLNSSHTVISYAVFCLKKKNKEIEVVRITLHEALARVVSGASDDVISN